MDVLKIAVAAVESTHGMSYKYGPSAQTLCKQYFAHKNLLIWKFLVTPMLLAAYLFNLEILAYNSFKRSVDKFNACNWNF